MLRDILNFIVCPGCQGLLVPKDLTSSTDTEVLSGFLECGDCQNCYKIIEGVPVLKVNTKDVKEADYQMHAKDFDKVWEKFESVISQEDLDNRKTNPDLTKNSTRMQLSTLYKYSYAKQSRILDVGCGLGFDLKRIKERFPDCVLFGFDVSEMAVRHAQRMGAPAFLTVAFAEKLPYPESFFDLIISHEVLEHVVDPSSCLREMGRVLTQNGRVVISTPNGKGFFSAFVEPAKLGLKKVLGRSIERHYKDLPLGIAEIEKICSHHRLQIKRVIYTCPFYFLGNLITEHMPVSVSNVITKLIIRYSDKLAKIPYINAVICDEMTIIVEKTDNSGCYT